MQQSRIQAIKSLAQLFLFRRSSTPPSASRRGGAAPRWQKTHVEFLRKKYGSHLERSQGPTARSIDPSHQHLTEHWTQTTHSSTKACCRPPESLEGTYSLCCTASQCGGRRRAELARPGFLAARMVATFFLVCGVAGGEGGGRRGRSLTPACWAIVLTVQRSGVEGRGDVSLSGFRCY